MVFSFKNTYRKYYKWTLPCEVTIEIPKDYPLSDFENEWIIIKDNTMTIHKEYSWDGCSPKRILLNKYIIGTWDGPINKETGEQICYYPSLIHDVLCQFRIGTRRNADHIFYWMMSLKGFKCRWLYYSAVRVFGLFVKF